MVSPVKRPKEVNGYKIGDLVLLMRRGKGASEARVGQGRVGRPAVPEGDTFDVGPSTIGRVGAVGFFVRGSMAVYYWHEEGRTWKRFVEEKKSS